MFYKMPLEEKTAVSNGGEIEWGQNEKALKTLFVPRKQGL